MSTKNRIIEPLSVLDSGSVFWLKPPGRLMGLTPPKVNRSRYFLCQYLTMSQSFYCWLVRFYEELERAVVAT